MATTYLKLREGQWFDQKDKENKNVLPNPEGEIVGLYYRDEEWEGVPFEKLYLTIKNQDGFFTWGVRTEDSLYVKLVGFLKSANLKQSLALEGAFLPDQKGVKRNTIFVKQNGQSMKSSIKRDDLPEWKKVKVGKKDYWDKEEYLQSVKSIVEKDLLPQVPKFEKQSNTPEPPKQEKFEEDSLPF